MYEILLNRIPFNEEDYGQEKGRKRRMGMQYFPNFKLGGNLKYSIGRRKIERNLKTKMKGENVKSSVMGERIMQKDHFSL